ncbi:MAG: alanine racemase [Candidatus Methylacidiphilales bacterium]
MKPRPDRTWCDIDLAALRHNVRFIRRQPGCGGGLLGVVKANAYGHGLLPIARALEEAGASWLGTANLEEALALRSGGIRLPILLLSAALPGEVAEIVRQGFTFTWSNEKEVRDASRAAAKVGRSAQGFLKIDTGMGRLGCFDHEASRLLERCRRLPGIECLGLSTHFAGADEDLGFAKVQRRAFAPWLRLGLPYHTSNSAATLRTLHPSACFARVGLALYGCSPLPAFQRHLRSVLTWKARITNIRTFPATWPISYGSTYRTKPGERLAVLAVGYGDGLFRALGGRGHVLVRGIRCPIRGRVTMDQTMIDVSRVPTVRPGDTVTLIGTSGTKSIRVEEMAAWVGTIPYEIWTHIQGRVPRRIRGER